jgi:transposase
MTKEEILTLAAKAFGNGKPAVLSEAQKNALLERCAVDDPYHLGPDGKPEARKYYSSRRLIEYVRQQRKNVKAAHAA